MSWSVYAAGKPAAVKAALASKFAAAIASTAQVPHEQESVKLVEQIVNGQLDFLAGATATQAVIVEANGSAYSVESGEVRNRGSRVKLRVEAIPGFVE